MKFGFIVSLLAFGYAASMQERAAQGGHCFMKKACGAVHKIKDCFVSLKNRVFERISGLNKAKRVYHADEKTPEQIKEEVKIAIEKLQRMFKEAKEKGELPAELLEKMERAQDEDSKAKEEEKKAVL
ncbi:hypothetical protein ENBRE01_1704 [Enteropsectra breve]|nr:hypothetical protein ENBRE01_1704 [Enteropsectra breve]